MKKLLFFIFMTFVLFFNVQAQLGSEKGNVELLRDGSEKISLINNPLACAVFTPVGGDNYELHVKDEIYKVTITHERGEYDVTVNNVIEYQVGDDHSLIGYHFIGNDRSQTCLQHSIAACYVYTTCEVACMNSLGAYAFCLIIWVTMCILEAAFT